MSTQPSKTYSVYNYDSKQYDYYSSQLGRSVFDGIHDSILREFSRNGNYNVGQVPEKAVKVLPANAVRVGSGQAAVGEIVDTGSKWGRYASVGIFAIGAYFVYKLVKSL